MSEINRRGPVVALDVGGTKLRAALVDRQGRILHRDEVSTLAQEGPEAVIGRMEALIRHLTEDREYGSIGIAMPGPLNPREGIVYETPNLPGWHNVPLAARIAKAFETPVRLDNDANLAALGEHRFGAGRGAEEMVYITVSTGIGGGIITRGELLYGWRGSAAEVGHMVIEPSGPRCGCGNRGCLEALASGTAIAREAIERIQAGAVSAILDLADGEVGSVTGKTVTEAAAQGDHLAQEILEQASYYLGIGIATLLNLLNPQLIILGGGVALSGRLPDEPMWRAIQEHALPSIRRGVEIKYAALGDDAGLLGASVIAFEELERSRTKV
ncbi:MAG: ROK family protein [Chloroflexi bacterium]|nr:ROK family protein [Chloroflexota bacterium]